MTESDIPEAVPQFTLPKEYQEAIGGITVNAALMDQLIDHTIAVFLQTSPPIARLITDPILSTTRKIKLLKGIADEIAPTGPTKKQFHEVYSKLQSAQAHRSKIIHARWRYSPKTNEYYIVSAQSDEGHQEDESIRLPTLLGYAHELAQAYQALEKFLHSIQFVPGKTGVHAWPPVHTRRSQKKK